MKTYETLSGTCEIEIAAPLTGLGYSVSGCSGGGGISSADGGGVELSCEEGPAATINDAMSLQVVEIVEATAAAEEEPEELFQGLWSNGDNGR